MKRLLVYLLGVVIVVVVADVIAGYASKRYLRTHRLPGDCASVDYTIKDADQDVIILGNSVMLNSLMPSVLDDTLGMTVYNAASNGQQMAFFHSLLDCMLMRHKPKVVILGLYGGLLYHDGVGPRYNLLSPYYGMGYHRVDSCLESVSPYQKYFLKSSFYRFNSIWWRMLLYHIVTPNTPGENGFIAKPAPPFPPELMVPTDTLPGNESQMEELRRFAERCRREGIQLIALFPPRYYLPAASTLVSDKVREMGREIGFDVIDDTSDAWFLEHPELFYDNVHLNGDGAMAYSRRVAPRLRSLIRGEQRPDTVKAAE